MIGLLRPRPRTTDQPGDNLLTAGVAGVVGPDCVEVGARRLGLGAG